MVEGDERSVNSEIVTALSQLDQLLENFLKTTFCVSGFCLITLVDPSIEQHALKVTSGKSCCFMKNAKALGMACLNREKLD